MKIKTIHHTGKAIENLAVKDFIRLRVNDVSERAGALEVLEEQVENTRNIMAGLIECLLKKGLLTPGELKEMFSFDYSFASLEVVNDDE
jgi:hypothetical protein